MLNKLFWSIFTKFFLLVLCSFLVLTIFLSYTMSEFHYNQTELELKETAAILKNIFDLNQFSAKEEIQQYCMRLGSETGTRITIIGEEGVVLADSREDPSVMDNHSTRPEVHLAIQGHQGSSLRFSDTLSKTMLYLAVPLFEQDTRNPGIKGILRVARPVSNIEERLTRLNLRIYLAGTIILIITALVSLLISRSVNGPILKLEEVAREYAQGHFDIKTRITKPVEIGTLSKSMNYMSRQLKIRIETINNQKSKLEAILEHMVEPVILLDENLLIQDLNHATCRIFGIEKTKASGHSLIEIIRNIELYDCARRTQQSGEFTEAQLTIKYGQELHLQIHATPLFDREGSCNGQLMVMNDITRLIKLENMRKEFVANVSHELKTPITAIKGFVETLQDGAIRDRNNVMDFLKIINRQTNRLNTIINDLLALSRLEESEKSGIEKASHRPADLCEAAMKNCRQASGHKQITVTLEADKEFSLRVNGFLIEQALTNLLDNAIKYSPEGSRIEVSCGLADGEPGFEIAVKDNGCGIPPADLPHIFERFYRVDKARSRALGGTGLGLSIVKHIMLAHGGEVDVKSQVGEGSTFYLRLPL